ncbi:hypothetical protein KAR48_20950, partial [bacterium]|nr:hypothetical protein [bacterium]
SVSAQTVGKAGFKLGEHSTRPVANTINDILIDRNIVWVGTSRGLMRTIDRGETWTVFDRESGLGKGGVSAIAAGNGVIWVATGFDTSTSEGSLSAGGGLAFSKDEGESWQYVPQPVDDRDEQDYKPTTTVVQNITYDIAITKDAIWIASWGGGLRRSYDEGITWEVVTVDGNPFDVANNNVIHMAFSVHYDGEALWVGSAGGIHKSIDGGENWTTFNQHQAHPISGNFVVAIASQQLDGRLRIWAATIEALGEGERRAASYSDDGGLTWSITLKGEFPHNFGFNPNSGDVFAATDNGVMKSADGEHWATYSAPIDYDHDYRVFTMESTAAASDGNDLWAGFIDGLALTDDNGGSWRVFRAYAEPGESGEPETYAYPNPFSPGRHNILGDDGHVRLVYLCTSACDVTIRIFDFSMSAVKTVVHDKMREAGTWSDYWDGRNDLGDPVANGVYHYRVERTGHGVVWGKIMILN